MGDIQQYTIVPQGKPDAQPLLVAPVDAYVLFFEVDGMGVEIVGEKIGALLAEKAGLEDRGSICHISVDPSLRCGYLAFVDEIAAKVTAELFPFKRATVTEW